MKTLIGVRGLTGTGVTCRVGFVQHLNRTFIDATPLVAHFVKHGTASQDSERVSPWRRRIRHRYW